MIPVLIAKENVPCILQIVGHEIEELIQVFSAGSATYTNVVQCLYTETRQLWILASDDFQIHGWLVSYMEPRTMGKRLVLDLFGGKDIQVLLDTLYHIEDWAKALGATEVMAFARPGIRKKLKQDGFHHVCDLIVKPLTGIH